MITIVQLIDDSLEDFNHAYRHFETMVSRLGDDCCLLLVCRVKDQSNGAKWFYDLNINYQVNLFKVTEQVDISILEAKLDSLVAMLQEQVDGDVYYLMDYDNNPLAMMLLVKMTEGLCDKLHCDYIDQLEDQWVYNYAVESQKSIDEQLFLSFVESHNYTGIFTMIRQNRIRRELSHFIKFMIAFNNFGLDSHSASFLKQLEDQAGQYPQLAEYLPVFKELRGLVTNDQLPFIKALYFNCKIEYEHSDFVDFLVRYLRLLEELVMYAMGWDEDGKMLKYKNGAKKGQRVRIASKELSRMLEIFNQDKYLSRKYHLLNSYLNSTKVQKLVEIRHSSVAGHGYQGVSKEVLDKIYHGDILADLHEVIESLGINLDYDYYEVLNAFLIEEYYHITNPKSAYN